MKKGRKAWLIAACTAALLTAAMAPSAAWAQDSASEETEIIVTGTRSRGITATQSLSPIDVVSPEELTNQGATDLTDQLTSVAPSINTQRFPIADGTAVIRPVNLRNLPPDQTLVMINGSRRHRSALVNLQTEPFGTVNQGAQAVDFQLIPAIAVGRLEVLRDGASAQYGSDAIAGVINVILRDNPDGLEVTGQYGKFYAGDGENYQVAANLGLPLGGSGFLNLSAEYVSSAITSRGSARPDAAAVAAFLGPDVVPFNGLGQRWGDPDAEGFRFFANSEFSVGGLELYGHASYADQDTFSGFFYRGPFGVPGVTPRETLCRCVAGVPTAATAGEVAAITNLGLDPADYLTPDGLGGWLALNPIHPLFPGGYNPTFAAEIRDYAIVLGTRGELGSGMTWDLSARLGQNELSYFLENSINPSLGRLSPTSFNPGNLEQRETGVNLDFVYPWQAGLAEPINVAFGVEWRDETYTIGTGDPASFEVGPTASIFGFGSDGFQGDAPDGAGEFSSESYAAYFDIDAPLTERLDVGVAGRFEDYDIWGDTFDWKVAFRYQVSNAIALRATTSTGFRSPTPGQINTLDVTTTANSTGQLVPLGTFPVDHPVALILGSQPLDPETSLNYTAGLIFTPSATFSATLDIYQIDVDDRIALLSQEITPGSPEAIALANAGFPGIGTAGFFANAFDTRVRGVEIALTKRMDLGGMGDLTLDARHSWNEQRVQTVLGPVSAEALYDFENQLPAHRSVVTATWDYRNFSSLVRMNYYDDWKDFTFGQFGDFGSEFLFDAAVTVTFMERHRFTIGADNIFDEYPDDESNTILRSLGATRPISSPFGFNGGFWYVRLNTEF